MYLKANVNLSKKKQASPTQQRKKEYEHLQQYGPLPPLQPEMHYHEIILRVAEA